MKLASHHIYGRNAKASWFIHFGTNMRVGTNLALEMVTSCREKVVGG